MAVEEGWPRLDDVLTLRALGGASLLKLNVAVAGRVAQRRRVALLTLLASGPEGRVSRDKLIGYLWPEHDEASARHLLSESVYVLRHALGEGIIRSAGDALELNRERLDSDVGRFLSFMQEGRYAEAVAAYGGPLLDGFHLHGASEFERWVDQERARLRALYRKALECLAVTAEETGAYDESLRWWELLLADDPYDARAVIGAMQAEVAAGRRGDALLRARRYGALLREEFGAEPDPRVQALAERVRLAHGDDGETAAAEPGRDAQLEHARAARVAVPAPEPAVHAPEARPHWVTRPAMPSAPFDPTRPTPAPTLELPPLAAPVALVPPATSDASGSGRSWSATGGDRASLRTVRDAVERASRAHRRLLAAAIVVLVPSLVVAGEVALRAAAAPDPARARVAVLPFEVRTTEVPEYLSAGVAELLGLQLEESTALTAADAHEVEARAAELPRGPSEWSKRQARGLAMGVQAGFYVRGALEASGPGRLRIRAQLYESQRGKRVAEATVEGNRSTLPSLVAELGWQLGRELGHGFGSRDVLAPASTSLEAVRHYLLAVRALDGGRAGEGVTHLREALRFDTAFALAHYRLAFALAAPGMDRNVAETEADLAVRYSAPQTGWGRDLALALAAFTHGEADSAEARYRALLDARPFNHDAATGLLRTLVLYNPVRGRSAQEGAGTGRALMAADSGNYDATFRMALLAGLEERLVDYDRLAARVDSSTALGMELRATSAFLHWDPERQGRTLARLADASPQAVERIAANVAIIAPTPSAARPLAAMLLRISVPPSQRAYELAHLAYLAAAEGKLEEADRWLQRLSSLDPVAGAQHSAALLDLPFLPLDTIRCARLLGRLEIMPPGEDPVFAAVGPYLAGRLALRLGDLARARANAVRVRAFLRDSTAGPLARTLDAGLEARLRWARGDAAGALQVLDSAPIRPPLHLLGRSPFATGGAERFLRAQILESLGRDEEALSWYVGLTEHYLFDLPYRAEANRRMAAIERRTGDPYAAFAHLNRFVRLWASADPSLQPAVSAARTQIGELARR